MRYASIFQILVDLKKDSIPTFIPTFNQPTLLKMTLEQLDGKSDNIVVYDNASTSEDMLELLEEISGDIDVVFSNKNTGPRIFTEDIQILSLMPDYFVVTDPDLIYNDLLPKGHLNELKKIINMNKLAKAGFAIEIYDPEEQDRFLDKDSVLKWEEPYWSNEIGTTTTLDRIYDAWIDTTYALNKRDACLYHRKFGKPTFRYPSVRISGKYTCRHIGWWKKELIPQPEDEINNYLNTQLWSHTENHYYRGIKR